MLADNRDKRAMTPPLPREAEPATGEPDTPVGLLETDRFCDGCAYNLHTQPVWRDARLGILICRCPECGTVHPAGITTDAGRLWLVRLGTLLLSIWVVVLLWLGGMTLAGMGGLQYAHLEATSRVSSERRQIIVNGRSIQQYHRFRVLRVYDPVGDPRRATQMWFELGFITAGSVAIGLAAGGLLVVFLWHLPRHRYYFVLLTPAAVGIFLYWIWTQETETLRTWGASWIAFQALIQASGLVIGVRFGRPVVRLVLRTLLPPSLLQHLAFLWQVDHRPVPTTPQPETQARSEPRPSGSGRQE